MKNEWESESLVDKNRSTVVDGRKERSDEENKDTAWKDDSAASRKLESALKKWHTFYNPTAKKDWWDWAIPKYQV